MKKISSITKKLFTTAAVFLLLCATLATTVLAAYPSHTDFVSDGAVILDDSDEAKMIEASQKLERKRNARIAVCTVLNTDGEDIEDYASEIFRKWKIGNGVLILLSIEDDNFYAVQSNAVSEYLSESKLKSILNSALEPSFAEKKYSDGVLATVNALSVHLINELPEGFGEDTGKALPTWAVVLIVIAVIIAVILGGGYAALVILEKRQARRRREEMELRRRRLAEGRDISTARQRPGQQITVRRPAGKGDINRNVNGTRPQNPQARQSRPENGRRPSSANNAATIQINTADIREARQNRRP